MTDRPEREDVERVAKALITAQFGAEYIEDFWDDPMRREEFTRYAEAAIAAMLSLTEAEERGRRKGLEEAARIADAWYATSGWPTSRWTIGDEIRALAAAPREDGE